MAQGTKCCVCRHFNINRLNCPFHKEEIPVSIFVEDAECEHYEKKKEDDNNELPLAKGR